MRRLKDLLENLKTEKIESQHDSIKFLIFNFVIFK